MQSHVMQGAKYRATDDHSVMLVPHHNEAELWDYDLSAVFLHDTLQGDVPYRHEEIHA
jgi:hypothetical protein